MITEIKTKSKLFKRNQIVLINKTIDYDENFFTVLIGNNGTGKSSILNQVAKEFSKNAEFNKVISISSSASDKFPNDKYYKKDNYGQKVKVVELPYVYLGLRARNNMYSSKAQFNKAMDIMVECHQEKIKEDLEKFRIIFNYLDYEPVIKINYKLVFRKDVETWDSALAVIEKAIDNSNNKSFNKYKSLDNYLQYYGVDLSELIHLILEYRHRGKDEILFNFSSQNISRIDKNADGYAFNVEKYKALQILKDLKILRGMDVSIFKRKGEQINFNQASSGEIAIMSTLFGLIPLLEDNSLILIDEPEISLHPYWQGQYIPLLIKILEGHKKCHTILATHSHQILSDLPLNNSSVVTFVKDGRYIETNVMDEATYGWSAEDILLNVFNVPTTRNYYLSQLVSKALTIIKDNNYKTKEFSHIIKKLSDIEPHIKTDDPLKDIVDSIVRLYNE